MHASFQLRTAMTAIALFVISDWSRWDAV